MHIGIITFHCADNYGAVLQCYALKKYLEKLGQDVEVINYSPYYLTSEYKMFPSLKLIFEKCLTKGFFYTWENIIYVCICTFFERFKKKKKFRDFRIHYIGIKGKKIKKLSQKNKLSYDLYITGSDQVWNPKLNNGDITYYLNFVGENAKKISYAASIGTFEIEKYKTIMSQYLQRFDAISIREKSFKNLVEDLSKKKVSVVLDPVFLLNKEDWNNLIQKNNKFPGKFIFMYVFNKDDEAISLANYLSRIYNLPVIHFYYGSLRKKIEIDGKCFFFDGPIDFLSYIKHAEYIITNSFHCVTFSLIFQKEFYAYLIRDGGSRISDLLEELSLQDRLCMNKKPQDIIINTIKIDYNIVNNILDKLKQKSYNYLDEIIKGEKA